GHLNQGVAGGRVLLVHHQRRATTGEHGRQHGDHGHHQPRPTPLGRLVLRSRSRIGRQGAVRRGATGGARIVHVSPLARVRVLARVRALAIPGMSLRVRTVAGLLIGGCVGVLAGVCVTGLSGVLVAGAADGAELFGPLRIAGLLVRLLALLALLVRCRCVTARLPVALLAGVLLAWRLLPRVLLPRILLPGVLRAGAGAGLGEGTGGRPRVGVLVAACAWCVLVAVHRILLVVTEPSKRADLA